MTGSGPVSPTLPPCCLTQGLPTLCQKSESSPKRQRAEGAPHPGPCQQMATVLLLWDEHNCTHGCCPCCTHHARVPGFGTLEGRGRRAGGDGKCPQEQCLRTVILLMAPVPGTVPGVTGPAQSRIAGDTLTHTAVPWPQPHPLPVYQAHNKASVPRHWGNHTHTPMLACTRLVWELSLVATAYWNLLVVIYFFDKGH